MLEHGAMYVPYVVEYKEYYRLFTCIFLHFGFSHLMNNMLTLVVVGWNVEMFVGKARFLTIYLLSGWEEIYCPWQQIYGDRIIAYQQGVRCNFWTDRSLAVSCDFKSWKSWKYHKTGYDL
mgnify:CR=1 FL=1